MVHARTINRKGWVVVLKPRYDIDDNYFNVKSDIAMPDYEIPENPILICGDNSSA